MLHDALECPERQEQVRHQRPAPDPDHRQQQHREAGRGFARQLPVLTPQLSHRHRSPRIIPASHSRKNAPENTSRCALSVRPPHWGTRTAHIAPASTSRRGTAGTLSAASPPSNATPPPTNTTSGAAGRGEMPPCSSNGTAHDDTSSAVTNSFASTARLTGTDIDHIPVYLASPAMQQPTCEHSPPSAQQTRVRPDR